MYSSYSPRPFLYRRDRRHRADYRRIILHIDDRQRQRKEKQQRAGDLVQDAVVS